LGLAMCDIQGCVAYRGDTPTTLDSTAQGRDLAAHPG
jgi:hypothetical protein